jgi:hypothetical protein
LNDSILKCIKIKFSARLVWFDFKSCKKRMWLSFLLIFINKSCKKYLYNLIWLAWVLFFFYSQIINNGCKLCTTTWRIWYLWISMALWRTNRRWRTCWSTLLLCWIQLKKDARCIPFTRMLRRLLIEYAIQKCAWFVCLEVNFDH